MFDLYTPGDAMGLNYVSLSGLSVTFLLTVRIIFIIPCAEQELHTSQEIRKAEGIIEFIRVHQPNQRIAKQSACLCSRRFAICVLRSKTTLCRPCRALSLRLPYTQGDA